MQIKLVKTADMEELEATANLLLMNGWERNTGVQVLPNGEYFMEFVKFTRMNQPELVPVADDIPRMTANQACGRGTTAR